MKPPRPIQAGTAVVSIGAALRRSTGFALCVTPSDMVCVLIALVYEHKVEAPHVVLLTDDDALFVSTSALNTVESYTQKIRDLVKKHNAFAVLQVVPVTMANSPGQRPVMHFRGEAMVSGTTQSYGCVVRGCTIEGREMKIDAVSDADIETSLPYFMLSAAQVMYTGMTIDE